jgi:uncharacterized protein (DUF2236 family)
MTTLSVFLANRLHETLSGPDHATEPPAWMLELEQGDDAGYFAEGSAVWTVHADVATLVAGVRALLMQALHPGAMAGVHDHSRYREDPFGRLAGTIRWVTVVSYGTTTQAEAASGWVRHIHERVTGEYDPGDGTMRPYSAADPDLLAWVHLAFADSFLKTHRLFGGDGGRVPGGEDAYVREWATAGELMGVANPPRSVAELDAQLEAIRASGVLRGDERTREAVRFLRKPPLAAALRPTYPLLFAGSVAALPDWARDLHGMKTPRSVTRSGTRAVLKTTAAILGPSIAVGAAARRQARLRGESAADVDDGASASAV